MHKNEGQVSIYGVRHSQFCVFDTAPAWLADALSYHLLCLGQILFFFRGEEFGFFISSNVKRNATGFCNALAIRSSLSKLGEFLPRSMRLRKSTEIPISSANFSWDRRICDRICFSRLPNSSRRVANFCSCTRRKCGVISLRGPPNEITGAHFVAVASFLDEGCLRLFELEKLEYGNPKSHGKGFKIVE